jgi:hypothetical protein
MIWVRRGIAAVLCLVLVALFAALSVVTYVNGSFSSPDYYAGVLRDVDAYSFVYDEALPIAFRESIKELDTKGIDVAAAERDTIALARTVFPPDWLQSQTEMVLKEMVPYAVGDTDQFAVQLTLGDRVPAVAEGIKQFLRGSATYDLAYNRLVQVIAKNLAESAAANLSYGITFSQAEVEDALRTALPKEWLAAQLSNAIDQTSPWAQGKAEHFSVTIPLKDRVPAIGEALKGLLKKSDASGLVLDGIVGQLVSQNVQTSTMLPYGIVVRQNEVEEALRTVATPDWVNAQADVFIDSLAAYLTGASPAMTVRVELRDRKEATIQAIASLADRKLEQLVAALPVCSQQQFLLQLAALQPNQLPNCRPQGLTYQQTKQQFGIELAPVVRQLFGSQVPDRVTLTESQVREILGPDAWASLQDLRARVVQGYTFTYTDLVERLGPENQESLERTLSYLRSSKVFTQEDLRDRLLETPDGQRQLQQWDDARASLHRARQLAWLLWVLPLVVLVAVAFLGGRTWGSRLAWGGFALAVSGLVLLIASAVMQAAYLQPEVWFREARATADPALLPLVDKGIEAAGRIAGGFAGGLRTRAIVALVIGLLAVGGGVALHYGMLRKPPKQGGAQP